MKIIKKDLKLNIGRLISIRYEKLTKMVKNWEKGELNFTPTCDKKIYKTQLLHMANYLSILRVRAKIENVDLGIEEENEKDC